MTGGRRRLCRGFGKPRTWLTGLVQKHQDREVSVGWKIATFNVNGIRARVAAVVEWLAQHRPDVLCLQELKCQNSDFPLEPFRDLGYLVEVRGQKAFNGVAILTRRPPDEVVCAFDDGAPDDQARLIAAHVDGIWVVNSYVPQGRAPDHPAFQQKLEFFLRLRRWFAGRFDPAQALIWTGDLNVAPEEIDVYDPKRMTGQVGFHPAEHKALREVTAWGFIDLFRHRHPGEKQFTFWDYRLPKSFIRNLGWRLDHIMVTEPLSSAAIACEVDTRPRGLEKPSDHTPVWAEFASDKLGK
jgi:exodeoxyribonuclease-3